MTKLIIRVIFFLLGCLLLLDAALPSRIERVFVDRHSKTNFSDNSKRTNTRETRYKLEFTGGSINSCSVGYSLYSRLNDGDELEVAATNILKRCTRISQGGQTLRGEGIAKYSIPIAGLLLIAAGLGFLKIFRTSEY